MKIFANNIMKKYINKIVLDKISVEFEKGSTTCIIGPNGAGKTTLLRILNMLEEPDRGEVIYDGGSSRISRFALQRRMTMVMQNSVMFNASVFNNIAYGLRVRGENEINVKVESVVKVLELTEFIDKSALNLSGGEIQRVAIARALVLEPEVLLLDEPTTHLDSWSKRLIQNAILSLQSRCKTTIILATYDIAEIERFEGRVFYLEAGKVTEKWKEYDFTKGSKKKSVVCCEYFES
ncbi:hypothetical protein AUJ66_06265 [Candidatus Desantisbacteria bacterium CG1_02_38_46]|uniref:Phosphate ABC transporter ATP-binding protein n=3 Tax=unclassified Candidatus Desantisiibacteriota TaxID=3106372 RepID=A0A2H9PAR9_9BACT|nr:MAG: hypothetical protein AUJ66_06265 [Candidatus Desantisbacteria bacterium CG1_02_38_46]PIU52279.1 MAG: phosphate ABC transporter ATP-binding protein [Candidatus Desantisbacteria bacterium CG07_land_8_20_14_0_80_39_15]PIZ15668.1 MAG: phosphate ABC transporter ATP-binding protein [Candidatus Desantisbacteria bacterium CG_4_10_14_0_8_um_filter_39_17]